jgi:tRNA threonylcarbamoyladenosine biosynthesis protein TsaE
MQPILTIPLADETATHSLGARLWPVLAAGDVVALEGDLGAGKTTLARGLIQEAMRSGAPVPSPTFTLVQVYDPPAGPRIWHFDLYRLSDAEELVELGWQDALADGVVLVEWPSRAGDSLPPETLWVYLDEAGQGRIATFEADAGTWAARLSERLAA